MVMPSSTATATRSRRSSVAPCATSPPAGLPPWADTSRSAITAAISRSPTTRAATATAPKCQATAAAEWMEARQAELLPVEYHHVVFTLPAALGPIALQNRRVVYGLLFKAAAETLQQIAADPKHLGAEIGFLAVLHTWGQNLQHHPHVHCVVPGGGLSPDGSQLGSMQTRLLPAGPGPQPPLPGEVSCPAQVRLRPGQAFLPRQARRAGRPGRVPAPARCQCQDRMGRLLPSRHSAARNRCSSTWPGTPTV